MDKDNEILMDGIDERIEAFLRGEMSAEEEIAFKQEIRQNPDLRNCVMAMTSLIHGLRLKNDATKMKIIREEIENEQRYKEEARLIIKKCKKSIARPIIWWACSIAAVFAIFFGIKAFLQEDIVATSTPTGHQYAQLEEIVSPYYNQYDMTTISRGDVDSTTVAHLYTLFSQIQESRNMSGIIKELDPIYQSLDEDYTYHPWANDIAWNLALAYIKDDQINKAILILEKIKQDNPDTSLYNKADEIIRKLSNL